MSKDQIKAYPSPQMFILFFFFLHVWNIQNPLHKLCVNVQLTVVMKAGKRDHC